MQNSKTESCRLCAASHSSLTPIFNVSPSNSSVLIADMITAICPIKIEFSDRKSKTICDECSKTIQAAYSLRLKSVEVDRKMEQMKMPAPPPPPPPKIVTASKVVTAPKPKVNFVPPKNPVPANVPIEHIDLDLSSFQNANESDLFNNSILSAVDFNADPTIVENTILVDAGEFACNICSELEFL